MLPILATEQFKIYQQLLKFFVDKRINGFTINSEMQLHICDRLLFREKVHQTGALHSMKDIIENNFNPLYRYSVTVFVLLKMRHFNSNTLC